MKNSLLVLVMTQCVCVNVQETLNSQPSFPVTGFPNQQQGNDENQHFQQVSINTPLPGMSSSALMTTTTDAAHAAIIGTAHSTISTAHSESVTSQVYQPGDFMMTTSSFTVEGSSHPDTVISLEEEVKDEPLGVKENEAVREGCLSSPCKHNGLCRPFPDDGNQNFRCACPLGRNGKFCEQETPSCDSLRCITTSDCVSTPSGALCICDLADFGQFCTITMRNTTEWETLQIVLTDQGVRRIEAEVGVVLTLLLLLSISTAVHCCVVAFKRQKYRDLYNEVVGRGELPSDLPPDWLDVHNHLCARYTMRPSSLPENFNRKDGQMVKTDGQVEKKKKKTKKKSKSETTVLLDYSPGLDTDEEFPDFKKNKTVDKNQSSRSRDRYRKRLKQLAESRQRIEDHKKYFHPESMYGIERRNKLNTKSRSSLQGLHRNSSKVSKIFRGSRSRRCHGNMKEGEKGYQSDSPDSNGECSSGPYTKSASSYQRGQTCGCCYIDERIGQHKQKIKSRSRCRHCARTSENYCTKGLQTHGHGSMSDSYNPNTAESVTDCVNEPLCTCPHCELSDDEIFQRQRSRSRLSRRKKCWPDRGLENVAQTYLLEPSGIKTVHISKRARSRTTCKDGKCTCSDIESGIACRYCDFDSKQMYLKDNGSDMEWNGYACCQTSSENSGSMSRLKH